MSSRSRFFTRLGSNDSPWLGLANPPVLAFAFTILLASGWTAICRGQPDPPNVILIITDDQGYGDIGAHGNAMIDTPNLDRLYENSFRLTNFHVDPTCAETRSALMTGRYSARTGVWHTIMGRSILRRDEITMADIFRANGYHTGMFGKWHLGDNYPYRPEHRGFEEVLSHGGGGVGQTPDAWGNDYFGDNYFRNGIEEPHDGYCTDVFFDAAKEFIRREQDHPFFCYLSTNAPHGPYLVDERYSQPYLDKGVPETMSKFYGMITNIDENLGELLETLDELNLTDNTIVIFMTDNGTAAGVAGRGGNLPDPEADSWQGFNAGMRGKKGSQFDGGHRVPCLIRCPRLGLESDSSDILAAHFDLLPTLIDWCELSAPSGVRMDGKSLARVRIAASPELTERTLFVHSQRIDHPEKGKKFSAMTQRWRLLDGDRLFDMVNDPSQSNNVADAHPEVVTKLKEAYDAWWDSISTRFDEDVRIDLGAEEAPVTLLTAHDWHPTTGGVPWNQNMIRNDPIHNGEWAVRVAQDGRYRFRLRSRPPGVDEPLSAKNGFARLKLGDMESRVAFNAGVDEAVIMVDLARGDYRLQTWLTTDSDETRGAYFVHVERLDDTIDQASPLLFEKGDRIALIGGTFIERMQAYNYFESYVISALPQYGLSFRNLGWSGDDVFGTARAVFGTTEDGYRRLLEDLEKADPTLVVLAYGGNEAFDGVDALPRFLDGYRQLIDDVRAMGCRVILLTPHRLEALGGGLPDPANVNRLRGQYGDAIKDLASDLGIPCVDFYAPLEDQQFESDRRPIIRDRLTDDGVNFNEYGYWRIAPELARRFGVIAPTWTVEIDLLSNEADMMGGRISSIDVAEGSIEFTTEDAALGFVGPPASMPRGGQMMAQHDLIRVKGLPEGRYGLQIDGHPAVLATNEQWRQGIRLIRADFLEQTLALRSALHKRNELFFHRHRPQNETYLFLFRKHEQGNNAVEVEQFVPLIAAEEERIGELSVVQQHTYTIVPVTD